MRLEVIAHEVEESPARAGGATDGEVQPGILSSPLQAIHPLPRYYCTKRRLREFASRSMSTPSGPFETLGARTRTTTRDDGSRDKRVPAPNPLSTTAGSSSRGRAASRQTAHGSVASTPGREKLPTSANRQVSARSQRPRYAHFMWRCYSTIC